MSNRNPVKLKHCPCCGSKADDLYKGGFDGWYIVCYKCGTKSGYFETKEEAETKWNTRVYEYERITPTLESIKH